jgi:hypothetical protein
MYCYQPASVGVVPCLARQKDLRLKLFARLANEACFPLDVLANVSQGK